MSVVNSKRSRILVALAVLPSIDCVLNQLNNEFHFGAANCSSLQIFRAGLLLVLFCTCFTVLLNHPERLQQIPMPAATGLLLLAFVVSTGLTADGHVTMTNLSAYGQMAYWLLLWTTASVSLSDTDGARLLLKGLAVGAVLTAASVFAGLIFGATNFYEGEVGLSSAGWFETAKMITGILVTGGSLLLYLGYKQRSWVYAAGAICCFAACLVTYARAGSVALAGVLCWLACWQLTLAGPRTKRWLRGFFLQAAFVSIIVLFLLPVGKIFARWQGMEDQGDAAGSGRATFWRIAVETYDASTPTVKLIGRGYQEMSEELFRQYGDDIKHTHDDALDLMLVAGVPGLLWLALFFGSLFAQLYRSSLRTPEGAVGACVLITFLCHSVLTGQIWGTDGMTYYTLSFCALRGLSTKKTAQQWTHGLLLGSRLTGPEEMF